MIILWLFIAFGAIECTVFLAAGAWGWAAFIGAGVLFLMWYAYDAEKF